MTVGDVAAHAKRRTSVDRSTWVRVVLPGAWAALLVGTVLLGARPTSLETLENALAAGRVDTVGVCGGLSPAAEGTAHQMVLYRQGPVRHLVVVTQEQCSGACDRLGSVGDPQVVHEEVGGLLASFAPGPKVGRVGPAALPRESRRRERGRDDCGA